MRRCNDCGASTVYATLECAAEPDGSSASVVRRPAPASRDERASPVAKPPPCELVTRSLLARSRHDRSSMPRWRTTCLILASLAGSFLLASCGSDGGPPATAQVTVEQVFAVPTPYGEEGTASFVAVERSGGSTTERFLALPATERPETLFKGELETGSYSIRSYQRTCPGSCDRSTAASEPNDEVDHLDPPSAECQGRFEIEKGDRLAVLVTLDPLDRSCEIDTGPPPRRLTRALIDGGFGATDIPKADLPAPRSRGPARARQHEEPQAKVPALAGSRIDLGGDAIAYVYRFESAEVAQRVAPKLLIDSNHNVVAACGRHVYYTDARRVPRDELFRRRRDAWQEKVRQALRTVDRECRAGERIMVIS